MQRTTLSISSTAEIMMTGMWRSRSSALQLLEHLVAVQPRHHDVEQHEVERLGCEQLQRLRPSMPW